jgi:uncharacterized membrane protein YcaP (DUF421 family)
MVATIALTAHLALPQTRTARLRTTFAGQPVVIIADGKPVGVLMPVKP